MAGIAWLICPDDSSNGSSAAAPDSEIQNLGKVHLESSIEKAELFKGLDHFEMQKPFLQKCNYLSALNQPLQKI